MKNKNKQTKFPVARIKKIMQKDEEVGKVAQATPVVISKALELFLGLIIEESSKVTTERGARRVEAYHLKHAVETVEMLDFLKELVQGVPDPSAGGTVDLEADAESKKKRGKGKRANAEPGARKRRKKKGEAEQENAEEDGPGPEVESKSEEGDMHMRDEDDESDSKHHGGTHSSTNHFHPRSSSVEGEEWSRNKPFMPRR